MSATLIHGSGLQSHGRSVLVWPQYLDVDAWTTLDEVMPLGARLIVFGDVHVILGKHPVDASPLCAEHYGNGTTAGPSPGRGAGDRHVQLGTARQMQALHRSAGLTPLPIHTLTECQGWHHVALSRESDVIACASRQRVRHPVDGAAFLLCCLAVSPSCRRRRLAATVNEARLPPIGQGGALALIEEGNDTARAFHRSQGATEIAGIAHVVQWT